MAACSHRSLFLFTAADEQLGVMTKAEALAAAAERELDLVLIVEKGDMPVRPFSRYLCIYIG